MRYSRECSNTCLVTQLSLFNPSICLSLSSFKGLRTERVWVRPCINILSVILSANKNGPVKVEDRSVGKSYSVSTSRCHWDMDTLWVHGTYLKRGLCPLWIFTFFFRADRNIAEHAMKIFSCLSKITIHIAQKRTNSSLSLFALWICGIGSRGLLLLGVEWAKERRRKKRGK